MMLSFFPILLRQIELCRICVDGFALLPSNSIKIRCQAQRAMSYVVKS